ncbi:MAG: hypothetical protein HY940_02220 [Gammaproteobacteria bacterium]|nr:hypothetical protein [Gammaproteobacteria bacterium]
MSAVAALLFSTQAPARDIEEKPKTLWVPATVNETLKPGQTLQVPVTFTAQDDAKNVEVLVSPEIAPYVNVQPAVINRISPKQPIFLTLTFSAPADALPTTTAGSIWIQPVRHFDDKDGNTHESDAEVNEKSEIAEPLPVSVNVVWTKAESLPNGISFSYPNFGQNAVVATAPANRGSSIVDVVFGAPGNPPSSEYRMAFIDNPTQLSLVEWFRQNVDTNGDIINSGGYEIQTLSNGVEVLAITTMVPEEYGPLADLYALSPSKATAIVLATGQANQFDQIGIDQASLKNAYLFMLSTMSTP